MTTPTSPTRVGRFWDGLAAGYDGLYVDRWSQREDAWVREQLRGFHGHVLDVGCGTGLGRELLPAGVRYTGVDVSAGMLRVARERHPGERFIQADAGALPFAAGTFDAVISLFGCLSYCPAPLTAAKEVVRVAKPGASALLMVFGRWSLGSLLRGTWSGHGTYATRRVGGGTPCRFFAPREAQALLPGARLAGLAALGGVAQWPALWPLDQALARVAPGVCHNLALVQGGAPCR